MEFFSKKSYSEEDYKKEIKRIIEQNATERILSDRLKAHATEDHERALTEVKMDHELAIKELKKAHELNLAQRDFDMKNQKDVEVLKYKAEADKAREDMSVLKKELEVTLKIVDINSDIVDVKDIINKLITALPKIDLTSLTVNSK